MPLPFLDTNIFLRHLTGEPADQAQKATSLFEKIERREIKVMTSEIVIFEIVFTLGRFYKKSKQEIRSVLLPLIELSDIHIEGKRSLRKVFDIYVEQNIPFADAYFVIFMKKKNLIKIISFDQEFDKINSIKRVEP